MLVREHNRKIQITVSSSEVKTNFFLIPNFVLDDHFEHMFSL